VVYDGSEGKDVSEKPNSSVEVGDYMSVESMGG
jgi:hypothetical protein